MAKDIDEEQSSDEVSAPDMDRITATIRRVQAQAAAFEAQAAAPEEATPEEEDPIEATIRRVQAQAAAQGALEPAEESFDEDPIEAAVRRVQAQAEANAAAEEASTDPPDDDDPIEATIRRVQVQAATARALEGSEGELPQEPIDVNRIHDETPIVSITDDVGGADGEEDPIEATIRRVQAQAAAQASPVDDESVGAAAEDEDPIEATIRRVQARAAEASGANDDARDVTPSVLRSSDAVEAAIRVAEGNGIGVASPIVVGSNDASDEEARPEATTWPGRDERLLGEAASWEVAARRLEQGLQDTLREVRELTARLEAMERLANGEPAPATRPLSVVPAAPVVAEDDDDWDDRPQVSSMQFGTPPRPPVYRDPSPQTATAAEFVVEEPAPVIEKPAARLRAVDAEGNLDDRIPRQYRITVEDKRRGVDLVPLHRAMQGLDSVKDMSLLSYSNGVAMVLVESVGPLDPEVLRLAVGRVMSRETLVEVHNEQTMVIKIQED